MDVTLWWCRWFHKCTRAATGSCSSSTDSTLDRSSLRVRRGRGLGEALVGLLCALCDSSRGSARRDGLEGILVAGDCSSAVAARFSVP